MFFGGKNLHFGANLSNPSFGKICSKFFSFFACFSFLTQKRMKINIFTAFVVPNIQALVKIYNTRLLWSFSMPFSLVELTAHHQIEYTTIKRTKRNKCTAFSLHFPPSPIDLCYSPPFHTSNSAHLSFSIY